MATPVTKTHSRPIPPEPCFRRGDGIRPDGWEVLTDPFVDGLDDTCVCLWFALRDVQQWIEATQRDGLFGHHNHRTRARLLRAISAAAPPLVPPLRTFIRLRTGPGAISAGELAEACYGVWRWADAAALPGTAAHYAETAAYLVPDNPTYANDAGWACRRCAAHERANVWYQRGFQLAVRYRNRYEAIRALIGRGAVHKDLGRHEEARQLYDRASRRALRTGRRRQAAVARHYLFALEAEGGSFDRGLEEVRTTLNLYPIYDRRVPYLAHDFAFLLIRNRYFAAALSLLEKLAPAITKPDERVLVESSIAWAAAAGGHDAQRREAERYVVDMAGAHPEYAAAGFIHLAHASRFVDELQVADTYAAHAEELASRRGDGALALEATALRHAIATRLPPEGENPVPGPYAVEGIAKMFSVRLRRWLAPDRRGTGANAKPANATDLERRRL